MKKITLLLLSSFLALSIYAQKICFSKNDLITTGVYYYPEHWDESQWERDLKNIADMGFEFTHFAEFAWAQLEPEKGKYDFTWLDKAIELADKYKLKVILCTSTATPPVWLVREHPEVLVLQEDGVRKDHGSRQSASFSSNFYRDYSLKMVEQLAKRYGNDERILGWQIDNEPTVFNDYNPDAQARFRAWLEDRYKTIGELNRVWATNFWSQTYSDFSQINIPLHSQWGMNLHQRLDHYRFMAHETASFLDEQASMIKKDISANQWVTTNYIPNYSSGHIGQSNNFDFITYTMYMVSGGNNIGQKGFRVGDPIYMAQVNDFFRPKSPHFGVMELQPGQVNWGGINPQVLPGAVRLWLWHLFGAGSEFACTYRYRAPIAGFEVYHYGVVGPDGITPTSGGKDFSQFTKEIGLLRKNYDPKAILPEAYLKRKTGILFNHENMWGMELARQTYHWESIEHIKKYYSTLKYFGAPVDFVDDSADFSQYPVIVVPAYQQIDLQLIDKLTNYVKNGGNLVMSCRTGHKTRDMHLWEAKYAEPIYSLIGAEIEYFDLPSQNAGVSVLMDDNSYSWSSWGDIITADNDTQIWGTYQNDYYEGKPAVTFRELGKGTVTYVGVDSDRGHLEKAVLKKLYKKLNIPIEDYPEGVLIEYRDGFGIAVNYSDKKHTINIPRDAEILVGTKEIRTAEVVVWKLK